MDDKNIKLDELVEIDAASGWAADLAGLGPRIMFAPEGEHTIDCGLGGKASATVTIRVDRSTADVLQASLMKVNHAIAPQRALFDFEHTHKEAMAWPTSFEWSDNPRPGVYASAEYSSLGKNYVDGKVVRAFSGSFFTDADLPKRAEVKAGKHYEIAAGKRGSAENPARIISLAAPYAGTLTNNPAFVENLPLWATRAGGETNEQSESSAVAISEERVRAVDNYYKSFRAT